jgi:hypothetical protein
MTIQYLRAAVFATLVFSFVKRKGSDPNGIYLSNHHMNQREKSRHGGKLKSPNHRNHLSASFHAYYPFC